MMKKATPTAEKKPAEEKTAKKPADETVQAKTPTLPIKENKPAKEKPANKPTEEPAHNKISTTLNKAQEYRKLLDETRVEIKKIEIKRGGYLTQTSIVFSFNKPFIIKGKSNA